MDSQPLHPDLHGPNLHLHASLQHAADVRRLARRLVRDDASADDLAQETWLSALQRGELPSPSQGWQRWLFGVARNVAREGRRGDFRRIRREQIAARPESQDDAVTPDERLEAFQLIAGELGSLSEPYRSTLLRRYFESLSFEDIARIDGVSAGTVRSRHARGLEFLRERLDRKRPGGRAEWLAMIARLDTPTHAPLPHVIGSWSGLATALAVIAALGAVLFGIERLARAPASRDVDVRTAANARDERPREDASLAHDIDPESIASRASDPTTPTARASALAPSRDDARQPLILTVVDERTSTPLAGYLVRAAVLGAGASAAVTASTDLHGRVEIARAPPSGTLAVTQIDEPRLEALRRENSGQRSFPWTVSIPYASPDATTASDTTHREGDAPPVHVELRVAVGPTLRLVMIGAPQNAWDGAWVELVGEDVFDDARVSRAPLRAPLEAGDTPWVRFLAEAPRAADTALRRVRVTSLDGAWFGEAVLEADVDERADAGGVPPLVTMTAERRAANTASDSDASSRGASSREPWIPQDVASAVRASSAETDASAANARSRRASSAHDDSTRRTLKLRAVDAVTGERIDVFSAEMTLIAVASGDADLRSRHSSRYGNLDFVDVPVERSIRFVAVAPGYRPVHGDRSAFTTEDDHDVARLAFVRGWQRCVRVCDATTRAPIVGARVEVDGARLGVTDRAGEFVVTLPAAPTRLDVRVDAGEVARDPTASEDLPGTTLRFVVTNGADTRR